MGFLEFYAKSLNGPRAAAHAQFQSGELPEGTGKMFVDAYNTLTRYDRFRFVDPLDYHARHLLQQALIQYEHFADTGLTNRPGPLSLEDTRFADVDPETITYQNGLLILREELPLTEFEKPKIARVYYVSGDPYTNPTNEMPFVYTGTMDNNGQPEVIPIHFGPKNQALPILAISLEFFDILAQNSGYNSPTFSYHKIG